jgi:hypothetical protein
VPEPRTVRLDPLTVVPIYLECFLEGASAVASGTGFFLMHQRRNYLITNWHVVTGRHPDTGDMLCPKTALCDPNRLKAWLYEISLTGRWCEVLTHLRDENGRPCWLEHPRGREIDVVALPIPPLSSMNVPEGSALEIYPMPMELADTDMMVQPAEPVCIIGFPGGISVNGRIPIWKTGHLASDLDLNYAGKPRFLVDATTGSGMSGSRWSPVDRAGTANETAPSRKVRTSQGSWASMHLVWERGCPTFRWGSYGSQRLSGRSSRTIHGGPSAPSRRECCPPSVRVHRLTAVNSITLSTP